MYINVENCREIYVCNRWFDRVRENHQFELLSRDPKDRPLCSLCLSLRWLAQGVMQYISERMPNETMKSRNHKKTASIEFSILNYDIDTTWYNLGIALTCVSASRSPLIHAGNVGCLRRGGKNQLLAVRSAQLCDVTDVRVGSEKYWAPFNTFNM